jgi:hypothetical protein
VGERGVDASGEEAGLPSADGNEVQRLQEDRKGYVE